MRRRTIVVLLVLAMLVSLGGLAAAAPPQDGAPATHPDSANLDRLVVLLEGESVAAATGTVHGPEAEAHRAELAAQRAEFLSWLAGSAPRAEVVWEYDTVLHGVSLELHGESVAAIAAGPRVRTVMHPVFMDPVMNTSLLLIGWPEATGQDFTEKGVDVGQDVKVGVIDTGIPAYEDDRRTHPFFVVDRHNRDFYVERGRCKHPRQGETEFTNCKVFVAKVFKSDDPDATAEALHPHGSHVAGTIGGNSGTDAPFTGPISGIAPAVFFGNYNVFPGEQPESASSDDIAMAVEEAVEDGMDVLNLSLGGSPPPTGWTSLELALLDAAKAGVLSAVAAGNSGPGDETVQAPGRAPWVLTAGASTNPHFLGQEASHKQVGSAGAAVGDFDPFPDPPVTKPFVWWGDLDHDGSGLACEPLHTVDLGGDIALIQRGECTFTTKIRHAEQAGAGGVVIFNNVAGDPVAMAHDGTDPFPTIPAVMVSNEYGTSLVPESGTNLTVGGPIDEQEGTPDIIAGFSSRGPADTPDGVIIKPDLTAPGVNVYSSVLGDDFAMFQGTSMATPHLAGAAAALFWSRGWLEPDQGRVLRTKSLITNSASLVVLDHEEGTELVGVNHQGTGRLQLDAAWDGDLYADPVSVSFGEVKSGALTVSESTRLLGNLEDLSAKVSSTSPDDVEGLKVEATVDDSKLVITITRPRGFRGEVEGYVTVESDGGTIRVAYWIQFG